LPLGGDIIVGTDEPSTIYMMIGVFIGCKEVVRYQVSKVASGQYRSLVPNCPNTEHVQRILY
jgi:hypothetical protein